MLYVTVLGIRPSIPSAMPTRAPTRPPINPNDLILHSSDHRIPEFARSKSFESRRDRNAPFAGCGKSFLDLPGGEHNLSPYLGISFHRAISLAQGEDRTKIIA